MTYTKGKNAPYSDQKNWSNDYLTDPKLITALGPFKTDPACPKHMPWRTATDMFYLPLRDGLKMNWKGRTWLNPPYRGVLPWARKFVDHGDGIILLNGRSPETKATQLCLANASGVFFPSGRLIFYRTDGEPFAQKWFPSILIAVGDVASRKLATLPSKGFPGVFLLRPLTYWYDRKPGHTRRKSP